DEAVAWLQIVPYKGALPTAVPTDPLIYRWYEIVSVYGTTIKALIHEEFGDGIMSAIDFSMDIQREPEPKGERGKVVLSGKLPPSGSSDRRAPYPAPAPQQRAARLSADMGWQLSAASAAPSRSGAAWWSRCWR